MSKTDVLPYLEAMLGKDIYITGEGKKGDPKRYFGNAVTVGKPASYESASFRFDSHGIGRCPKCNEPTDTDWHKKFCVGGLCQSCELNKTKGLDFNVEWGDRFCCATCAQQGGVVCAI